MICRGCENVVTEHEIQQWNGFCENCIETGHNFDDDVTEVVDDDSEEFSI
jgi:hypothetical protein